MVQDDPASTAPELDVPAAPELDPAARAPEVVNTYTPTYTAHGFSGSQKPESEIENGQDRLYHGPEYSTLIPIEKPLSKSQICGLTRKTFIIAAVVIILVTVAAIAGGVGGALANKSSGTTNSSPVPTTTSSPSTSPSASPSNKQHTNETGSFDTWEASTFDKWLEFSEPFDTPPNVALAFTHLDTGPADTFGISAFTDQVNETGFMIHVKKATTDDATLYSAACDWIAVDTTSTDVQIGQYSTLEDHTWLQPQKTTSQRIDFDRAYNVAPKVVVWITGFAFDQNRPWSFNASATNIDAKGFTVNIDCPDSTNWCLYVGNVSWIAYPSNSVSFPGWLSGEMATEKIGFFNSSMWGVGDGYNRSGSTIKLEDWNSLQVGIATESAPVVIKGFSYMHLDTVDNFRLDVRGSVSNTGSSWEIVSWWYSVFEGADVNWLALF